jgi:hypothetical protein
MPHSTILGSTTTTVLTEANQLRNASPTTALSSTASKLVCGASVSSHDEEPESVSEADGEADADVDAVWEAEDEAKVVAGTCRLLLMSDTDVGRITRCRARATP